MRDIPIPENPTVQDTFIYLKSLHDCIENNHTESTQKLTTSNRLSLSTAIAIIALVFTILGAVVAGAIWVGKTDASLSEIPTLVANSKDTNDKVNTLVAQVSQIQNTSSQDNEALLGNGSYAYQHRHHNVNPPYTTNKNKMDTND